MLDRDVADQLHHVDGLADAGTAEQTDLAALGERAEEVDHLDTGLEQFRRAGLFVIARGLAVDGPFLFGADITLLVDRLAEDVHDAAEGLRADRHGDRFTRCADAHAATQPVRRAHRDAAHHAVAQLGLHLEDESPVIDIQCVVDLRHFIARELDVDHGADDGYDRSGAHVGFL